MVKSSHGKARARGGRPSAWHHHPTRTIRVPEQLADRVLEIARLMDEGFDGDIVINLKDSGIKYQTKQKQGSLARLRVYSHSGHEAVRIRELIQCLETILKEKAN